MRSMSRLPPKLLARAGTQMAIRQAGVRQTGERGFNVSQHLVGFGLESIDKR